MKTARLKILGDSSILQNVYVWITHLDPLQFTEPRASSMSYYCGLPMVQYSRAIQEKKKKSPGAIVHLQLCTVQHFIA